MKIRITFRKTSEVRWVSHLDMMRAFKRALRRSGLPIVYTEGFNVHPVMIFTPPLSVGYMSECELLDIALTERMEQKDILKALCNALPSGFMATAVSFPTNKISDMGYSAYGVTSPDYIGKEEMLKRFFSQTEYTVVRKVKSGEKAVDIAPYFRSAKIIDGGFEITLPSQNDVTVNPRVITDAIAVFSGVEAECDYVRKAIYDMKMAKL